MMFDASCPDCGDPVIWDRADVLIHDYAPYPEPAIRRVVEVLGGACQMWSCPGCSAFGVFAGLRLSA